MRRALIVSILAHAVLGVAVILGANRFGRELPVQSAVTVDIVTAEPEAPAPPAARPAEAAPLPPREAASPTPTPEPEPEAEPEPEPQPTPVPEPEPPPPPPTPAPALPEPAPVQPSPPEPPAQLAEAPVFVPRPPQPPKVEKVEPPRREPPKPEPAKIAKRPAAEEPKEAAPKPPADSFASLLKSVEKLEKRVEAPERRTGTGTAAANGTRGGRDDGAAAAANAAQLAAMISRQVTPCWRIPIGAQDAGRMRAELNIVMGPDGNVRSVVPLDEARLNGDPVFRAFAESAVRAVRACSPLKLPAESYDVWRNVIFNFDPAQMSG